MPIKVYQVSTRANNGTWIVTGPENHGDDGDGYYLGVFREREMAQLFIRALELADAGAPIGDDLD